MEVWGKFALPLPPSSRTEQRRGIRGAGGHGPAAWGRGGCRRGGEKGQRGAGIRFLRSPWPGCGEEAGQREQAAAALGGSGGGARELGENRHGVV